MIYALAARAFMMVANGAMAFDAAKWLCRNMPASTRAAWEMAIYRELVAAVA